MAKRSVSAFLFAVLLLPITANAIILQPEGDTFAIAEPDFRGFIQERLQALKASGALKTFKREAIERVRKSVQRPTPLPLAQAPESYHYQVSPEIVVNKDIRLPSGQLIAAQGTRINPMTYVHFNGALVFFNGDDAAQVKWVNRHLNDYPQAKLILTAGDVGVAANQFGRVYFDQEGRLTEKLAIKQVPAIATQNGTNWQIDVIGHKEIIHG